MICFVLIVDDMSSWRQFFFSSSTRWHFLQANRLRLIEKLSKKREVTFQEDAHSIIDFIFAQGVFLWENPKPDHWSPGRQEHLDHSASKEPTPFPQWSIGSFFLAKGLIALVSLNKSDRRGNNKVSKCKLKKYLFGNKTKESDRNFATRPLVA